MSIFISFSLFRLYFTLYFDLYRFSFVFHVWKPLSSLAFNTHYHPPSYLFAITINNNNNNIVFLRIIDYTKILALVLDVHETSFALESPFFLEATEQVSICTETTSVSPEFCTSSLSGLTSTTGLQSCPLCTQSESLDLLDHYHYQVCPRKISSSAPFAAVQSL